MNIFISIIITLIILFYVNSIISRRKLNPINSVNFKGTIGFIIGDSYELVSSRIKHLKLRSKDDPEVPDLLKKYQKYPSITTGFNKFNNVKNLEFIFNDDGKLEIIFIKIKPEQAELVTIYDLLVNKLEKSLGSPFCNKDSVEWIENNHRISLHYVIKDLAIKIS